MSTCRRSTLPLDAVVNHMPAMSAQRGADTSHRGDTCPKTLDTDAQGTKDVLILAEGGNFTEHTQDGEIDFAFHFLYCLSISGHFFFFLCWQYFFSLFVCHLSLSLIFYLILSTYISVIASL